MTSSDEPCEDCDEEFHGEAEPVRFIIADERAKETARRAGPAFERLLGLIPKEEELINKTDNDPSS